MIELSKKTSDLDVVLKLLSEKTYELDVDRSKFKKFDLSSQSRFVAIAAEEKGYDVEVYSKRLYSFEKSGVKSLMWLMSNTPVPAFYMAKSKYLTKEILKRGGVSVPSGSIILKTKEEALNYFYDCETPQVVKPSRGAEGHGVRVNIQSEKYLLEAIDNIKALSEKGVCDDNFVIEDYFEGRDVRLVVVGDKVASALVREPASVEGDGKSSIKDLVDLKNLVRKKSVSKAKIKLTESTERALLKQGYTFDSVIPHGKRVFLDDRGNVSAGADAITILPYVHPSYLELALRVKELFPELDYIGVDFLIKDFTKPASNENYSVIEVNARPALTGSMYPTHGDPVDVASLIVDYHHSVNANKKKRLGNDHVSPPISYKVDCNSYPSSLLNMRLIIEAAFRRGLNVHSFNTRIFEVYGNGDEPKVHFRRGISSLTSTSSKAVMDDKHLTKKILGREGINVPAANLYGNDNIEEALIFANKLNYSVVVKPNSGRGGKCVFVDLKNSDEVRKSISNILKTGYQDYLIEEKVSGSDFRIFVVAGEIKAVAKRVPANVVGNGIQSVRELVDEKNNKRLQNPYLKKSLISLDDEASDYLALAGYDFDSVPKSGEFLRLRGAANVSSGGDCIDVTEYIHTDFKNIARKAYSSLGYPLHFGLDLFCESISEPAKKQSWNVLEINASPDFGMHHFPSIGTERDVAGEVIESIYNSRCLSSALIQNKYFKIVGMEVASSHLEELWLNGCEYGLTGGVFRSDENSLLMITKGTHSAINAFCKKVAKTLGVEVTNASNAEVDVFLKGYSSDQVRSLDNVFVLDDSVNVSLEEEHRDSLYFVLEGKVTNVGFRRWIKNKAKALEIKGWVRNIGDNKIEGLFQGVNDRVRALLNSCAAGPEKSSVKRILTTNLDEKSCDDFLIVNTAQSEYISEQELETYLQPERAALFSLFPANSIDAKRSEIYNYVNALSYDDLSKHDVERVKLLLLDALGLLYLASVDERMDNVRKIGLQLGGEGGDSTVLGINARLSGPAAAFVNAAYMQLHDFNDGHRIAAARSGDPHPGRVVIPAALAEAQSLKVNGKQLITAIALGYDIATKIRGRRPNRPKSPQYAVSAVSSKLRNFTVPQISSALGYSGYLSASGFGQQASGTDKNFLIRGFQAYSGLVGPRIALTGQSGPKIEFDIKRTLPFLLSEAGSGFEVSNTYVKPYPTCRMIHSSIEALEGALSELKINHKSIQNIVVRQLPAGMYVAKRKPSPGINYKKAQFNMYYCLARYAVDRELTVKQFSDEKLKDAEVYDLVNKIEVVRSPELARGYPLKKRTTVVEVATVDGRTSVFKVDLASGNEVTLDRDLVANKFFQNCSGVITHEAAEEIYEKVMSIDSVDDVSFFLSELKVC
ncbi:MmgE/PrpD family protein [Vreelandella nigrificans]|nr:MmgE/PrpD family protein [Halomonas nigrificans]